MSYDPSNPLIVQSDRTVLLETDNDQFEEARDELSKFAELVKSPEHIHTYRITPLSLWNAAALQYRPEEVKEQLETYSKYEVPESLLADIDDFMERYGRIKLVTRDDNLYLTSEDNSLLNEVARHEKVEEFVVGRAGDGMVQVEQGQRGFIKHALIEVGYPVEDLAGYTQGDPLDIELLDETESGEEFELRDYQHEAVDAFWAGGTDRGGSGAIVLPCGAGKTIVALGAMAKAQAHALVLCTNVTALRQ